MNNKLMITAAAVTLAALFAPALTFVSFADDTAVTQTANIDYAATELFHSKFSVVDKGRARIAYKAVRKSAGPFLNGYVDYLSKHNVDNWSEDEQLAYWLNVQNTLVLQAVSFDTRKTNLKKLRGTAEKPGKLWTTPRFNYAGQNLSIADIENRIVSNFKDPNVVYGLYQGVRGGPKINPKAYKASTVRETLAKAGRTYVNSRGIVKAENQTVKITPVYHWHKEALFGNDDAALIEHLKSHARPRLASNLYKAKTVDTLSLNYRADNYEPPRANVERNQSFSGSTGGGRGFGS